MLVGHAAVALLAKQTDPGLSLGTAAVGALAADVLLFGLVLAGVEQVEFRATAAPAPYLTGARVVLSHSLVMTAAAAVALAAAYLQRGKRFRAGVMAAVVASHWVLDLVSHQPYLPFGPGMNGGIGWDLSDRLGMTMAIEGVFWAGAVVLYVRDSRSVTSAGRYVFWGGIAALTYVWYENSAGRPPRTASDAPVEMIILLGLTFGWAYWMNRARAMKTAPAGPPALPTSAPFAD